MIKQFWFETGTLETKQAIRKLRKQGYLLAVEKPEKQATPMGLIKLTMVTILNPDSELNVKCDIDHKFNKAGL